MTRIGCVVLTTGSKPDDLRRALGSLAAQEGVELEVAVVGNGWRPEGLPPGVRGVERVVDTGIPAGRNAGIGAVGGELVFFLDDDASLTETDALARAAAMFAADATLGMLQLRVSPIGDGAAAREWVPRLRSGDPARSSDVAHVWEGAVLIRRDLLEAIGAWPEDFRFVHEGVDLGWKVMDAGYRVHYTGDISVMHPAYRRARNDWPYYGARNRVWLARRYLPLPLGVLYVASFMVRALPRYGTPERRRAALRGYRDGMRGTAPRRRLRWSTLWRMTLIGRPPIL
jgi:GT2 family glycosyltransferase